MIGDRLPLTVFLGVYGSLVALGIGIPLGILAAFTRGSEIDRGVVTLGVVGVSAPAFATGIFLLYVFGVMLGWFPIFGQGEGFLDRAWHLTLPAVALGISVMGLVVKITRASMLEELQKDYVAFARARGLGRRRTTMAYVLRNALIPVVTAAGLIVVGLLTGAVLVEVTFGLPGLGSLLVSAVTQRDIPVIQGIVLILAVFVVLMHVVIDVLYTLIDPRIRFGRVGA
jgi:peptide/nickel transport system permease protein